MSRYRAVRAGSCCRSNERFGAVLSGGSAHPFFINFVAVSKVEIIYMIGVVQEDLPIQIKLR